MNKETDRGREAKSDELLDREKKIGCQYSNEDDFVLHFARFVKKKSKKKATRPDTRPISSRWRLGRGSNLSGQGQNVVGGAIM